MRLDRYDAIGTAATALTGAVYWAHASGAIGSARLTAAAMLATGLAACAGNGSRPGTVVTGTFAGVMSFLGVGAMVLGLAGLVTGWEGTVTGLAALVGLLWLATTVRHLIVPPVRRASQPAAPERPLAKVG